MIRGGTGGNREFTIKSFKFFMLSDENIFVGIYPSPEKKPVFVSMAKKLFWHTSRVRIL
jgi:hypothetical protein